MNFLKKISLWAFNKNIFESLFTPTFLLYATIIIVSTSIHLNFGQNIKNQWEAYPVILIAIGILMYFRSFVITYSNLRQHTQKKRGFAIGFDVILFSTVIFLVSLSINFLKSSSVPFDSLGIYAFCTAIFYVQLFLSQTKPLLRTTFLNFAYYVFGAILLYLLNRLGNLDSKTFSTFIHSVSYLALIFEIYLFFQVMLHVFKKEEK